MPDRPQQMLSKTWSFFSDPATNACNSRENTLDGGLKLRSLSPSYVFDQHKDYVEILKAELTQSGPDASRNIALTGHYGSGKSSVLLKTQQELEERGVKVINLSLPSLGIGDGRIRKDGDKALDKTNLIQKEIVKQLLYRRKPSDMPASRYSRLDKFHDGPALRTAAGVGVAVTGLALLARVPDKVRDALPSEAWSWVDNHLWDSSSGAIQWLSLLVVFLLTVRATLGIQRLAQQRIRITELAAGPTKITLSESSSSYFDEYLDEIVYFFQMSKTAVVIFEDLDRFKDPYIFETLRELNMLLNNAEQLEAKPIRFVYAIRDSIFEQLGPDITDKNVNIDNTDTKVKENEDTASPDQGETRRLMSTNRTKFFDLVVPMVPFISHRTSRDLIRQELDAIVPEQRPSNAVVNIVGAHLTDMRLIKNICNEYEVFRYRILTDAGLKELTADRLFSSIVYKNLYLADYEKIRNGTSCLDTLYRAYREWVVQQAAAARTAERKARAWLRKIDAIEPRAAALGTRLQEVLMARYLAHANTRTPKVYAGGTTHNWDALTEPDFWRTYLHDRGDMQVHYRTSYSPDVISFEKIQVLMGRSLSPDDWTDDAKAEVNSEIAEAVATQRSIPHASMSDALRASDRVFSYNGEDRSIADVAGKLFNDADLVLELLQSGLIDENFTLYITQFPGQAISAAAMNFIIKAVQPDVMDIEYHFGTGEEVDTDDIKAVLEAEEPRLLGGQSVYNIEIFDYLLSKDPDKLNEPIRRLVTGTADNHKFLDAYLISGQFAPALVQRLSGAWEGIFDYLIGEDLEDPAQDLLDAAIRGVRPELTYVTNAEQRRALATAIPDLPMVREPQGPERAVALAETLLQMGIQVDDLSVIDEPLRTELTKRRIYPITLTNLVAIMGAPADLSLNSIKEAREADVYAYVLTHLRDYLDALSQTTDVYTVADPDQFAEVLSDVAEADVDALEEVARGASADCMLSDLDLIEELLWPTLASTHRFALSARNVASYIDQHGIDSGLANWLKTAGAITVDTDDPAPLGPLALNLLNAVALGDDAALQLVDGLDLEPESIAAASLQKEAHSTVPDLVQRGLVPDDADAYVTLEQDEWSVKKNLILVSKNFPTYMTELPLSTDELFRIASESVPDAVKDVLLTELETFAPELDPKGATALAKWASAQGRVPTAGAILTMATKGGPGSARPILKLLGAHATTIDLELLKSALNALGRPYSQLTTPGTDRPRVDISAGVETVLTRLQKAEIVSTFKKNTKKQVFEVNKRRA
ncbi:hypothetical protein [Corynebacterium halotolerans]|uniref:YobI family P-loop NTPase n=1 Tax=Corynebacterium halotolerans TaxID=225326 RepID=UPI003CEED846